MYLQEWLAETGLRFSMSLANLTYYRTGSTPSPTQDSIRPGELPELCSPCVWRATWRSRKEWFLWTESRWTNLAGISGKGVKENNKTLLLRLYDTDSEFSAPSKSYTLR
jgi:hypothetical protein